MRPRYLAPIAFLALGLSAPADAQAPAEFRPVARVATKATPDLVVARLMSFDRNADGRLVADELPERMQNLVARGDSSHDGALDGAEIRRLALSPEPVQNGLHGGGWAIGEGFGIDTSRHIDGALDDLRLAAETKSRALEIFQQFMAEADGNALQSLLAAMDPLLSDVQMANFRDAIAGKTVNVPAIQHDGVTIFGARPEEAAGQKRVMVPLRLARVNLEAHIEQYALDADRKSEALEAIREFRTHIPGRLNETERSALVEQFRGLLTDEQRDDLRAALGRRPVVRTINASIRLSSPVIVRTAEPTRH
jgi:hypothetical protein